MKVVIADAIHPDGDAHLTKAGITLSKGPFDPVDLTKALADADGLIVRSATKVTKDVLSGAPRLKVVGRAGVGVDNIDVDTCKARRVTVVNTPAATTNAVAELTMAHLLALARQLPRATGGIREGKWDKKELEGIELKGRTLGLLGVGRIGSRVAELARAFGMRVIAFDPYVPAEKVAAMGCEPVPSRDALARGADVVSVHVPLTNETRHMVNERFLAACRRGVVVINCARGGVIDEGALLQGLESGHVGGAGLDVFEDEPPRDTPLFKHPRTSLTPHIGAATGESQAIAGVQVAEEVLTVLQGGTPRWRVA